MADVANPLPSARASKGDWHALVQFLPLFWPQDRGTRARLIGGGALMALTSGLGVLAPLLFATAVDALAADNVAAAPVALLLGYALVFTLARTFAELRWIIIGPAGPMIRANITQAVYEHVHRLGLAFHLSRKTGQFAEVISRGLNASDHFVFGQLLQVAPLVLDVIVVAAVLLTRLDAVYMVTVLATFVAYAVALIVGAEKHRPLQRRAVELWNDGYGQAIDGLLNQETVKYFGAEQRTVARLDAAFGHYEDVSRVALRVRTITTVIPVLIMGAGFTGLLWHAGRQVSAGELTVGGLVLVNAYLLQVLLPLERMAQMYRDAKQALINVEQLMAIFDEVPDVADAAEALALPAGGGELEFRGVSFAYDPRRPILHDISFRAAAGTTVALVGASGAGKTTVARLLFRFYDPTGGSIRVDGQDARMLAVDSLRGAIGVVPQDTVLFNDTLLQNIVFAAPGATREDVEEVARQARIHDFIAALPDGYDTVVGERGLKLSGGEKQRVAIARALLKRPRIFLFDEATSSLDSTTERVIQENLREVSRGATTVIIAHRLSTIVHADQILVFDQGRVVERGSHASLLADGGRYAALWARQQAEQQEAA